MDTTKANTEIILEFETLDEERYSVSIIEQIQFEKKLKEIINETMNSLIPKENSNDYKVFTSNLTNDIIHEAMMEKLDIDFNKIQD